MDTQPSDGNAHRRTFAVTGATGQQGGATVRALLAAGTGVRALTRNPDSDHARELSRQGAKPVYADPADAGSLREAFSEVDGLFAMTTFVGERGTEGEVEDGKTIADAAREAGVPDVVYSSVGGAERDTGIPHFESKRRVEEYMQSLKLPVTFVRPAFFMDNFGSIFSPQIEDETLVLRMPLPDGIPLQMVSTDDIGKVAAAALLDPSRVDGGSVEIAGDELTGEQIAAVYGEREGRPARYEPLPLDILDDPDQRAMFAWFADPPSYRADFALTKKLAPSVQDFATWLTTKSRQSIGDTYDE